MLRKNIESVIAPNSLQSLTNLRKQMIHPSFRYYVRVWWKLKKTHNTFLRETTSTVSVEISSLQIDTMHKAPNRSVSFQINWQNKMWGKKTYVEM